MDKKRIHIACGIILNQQKTEIFITQREPKAHQGGFWEFAGGKVESGETAQQAMARELSEEVGIEVIESEHFMALSHDYPQKQLQFDFFLVHAFSGDPHGKEGQPSCWARVEQLADFAFPEANASILEALTKRFS